MATTILKVSGYKWDAKKVHDEINAYALKWLDNIKKKREAGKARWKGVSKKRRSEIARAAVAKRWAKRKEKK